MQKEYQGSFVGNQDTKNEEGSDESDKNLSEKAAEKDEGTYILI